tara:strand:+ start:648 stop:1112 length:465 start_codon:yes stop_codon:yes gene_type:complete
MGIQSWSISDKCIELISELIPNGSTILELGSGHATYTLSNNYEVYSIEQDTAWVNKYPVNYIHAPLNDGWYDTKIVKENMPKSYDLLLIDGPAGVVRGKFMENVKLFEPIIHNIPIVIDDIHRDVEKLLAEELSEYLNKQYIVLEDDRGTGYIK